MTLKTKISAVSDVINDHWWWHHQCLSKTTTPKKWNPKILYLKSAMRVVIHNDVFVIHFSYWCNEVHIISNTAFLLTIPLPHTSGHSDKPETSVLVFKRKRYRCNIIIIFIFWSRDCLTISQQVYMKGINGNTCTPIPTSNWH